MNSSTVPVVVEQSPQQIQVLQRLSLLENALLTQDPLMKGHLAEIHKLLITYEELVHLLSNEDIAKIMEAQQIQTNTVLVASVTGTKGKASAGKKAAGLGLGDL